MRGVITRGCLWLETLCACAAISAAWVFGLATHFANSLSGWYALTFEGTLEISMTCLLIFAVLTPIGNTCGLALARCLECLEVT